MSTGGDGTHDKVHTESVGVGLVGDSVILAGVFVEISVLVKLPTEVHKVGGHKEDHSVHGIHVHDVG